MRGVLPLVDLVHGNVAELREFTGAATLREALRRVARWGAGAVVVHMGEKGAGYFAGGTLVRSPCFRAARVVNATGTGDLLSVVMMLLHRNDAGPAEKLVIANRLVSMYVAGIGVFRAAGALPTRRVRA